MINTHSKFKYIEFCSITKNKIDFVFFFRDNLSCKVYELCDAGKEYKLLTTFRNEIC